MGPVLLVALLNLITQSPSPPVASDAKPWIRPAPRPSSLWRARLRKAGAPAAVHCPSLTVTLFRHQKGRLTPHLLHSPFPGERAVAPLRCHCGDADV